MSITASAYLVAFIRKLERFRLNEILIEQLVFVKIPRQREPRLKDETKSIEQLLLRESLGIV